MRLYLLDLGAIDMDRRVIMPASAPGVRFHLPVPGFLIRTDSGATILIDTGMPREFLTTAPVPGARMRPACGPDAYVVDRLHDLGLRPADVTHVVATHSHFDHAGGLGEFAHATVVAQRAEVAAPPRPFPPDLRWHLLDGDAEPWPGVRLLATPGHTPGHQSVLVTTGVDGAFLLAIDAIYNRDQLAADDWGAYIDQDEARSSARRVQELARQTGATLVYGHDPEQWATLRHAPACYR